MTKTKKSISIALIMVVLITAIMPFSTPAFAASGNQVPVNDNWTRVYPAETNTLSGPINGYVKLSTKNEWYTHLDVRFIGKNGNVIWSECNAIDIYGTRTFYCGSDVYSIEAKSHWSGINIGSRIITVISLKK